MFFGRLKQQIKILENENKKLRDLLVAADFRRSVIISLDELIPKDQNGRKEYMARVAIFYGTIFKDKIQHFISEQLKMLARIGLTKEEENILRSNINCFQLIDEWCQTRTNEHAGNLVEAGDRSESAFDVISNIKDKYSV